MLYIFFVQILFGPDGNIIVVDTNNHRLVVISKDDGSVIRFIGNADKIQVQEEKNHFKFPLDCCVSNDGRIYVLDSKHIYCLRYQDGYLLHIISLHSLSCSYSDKSIDNKIDTVKCKLGAYQIWIERHGMMVVLHSNGLLLLG